MHSTSPKNLRFSLYLIRSFCVRPIAAWLGPPQKSCQTGQSCCMCLFSTTLTPQKLSKASK